MDIPDAWSLITGIAGILSLFLTLPEKYANWRRYLAPASAFLVGFAIGRLSLTVVGDADQLLSDPAGARALVLALSLFAALSILAYVLIQRGETGFAYAIIVAGIIFPAQLVIINRPATDVVSVDDYMLLATTKAQSQQFDTSLKYLAAARKLTESEQMRRSIDKQIELAAAEAAKPKTP